MKGYALMGELSVDPGSRGQQMSGLIMGTYGKALSYEPRKSKSYDLKWHKWRQGTAKFFWNRVQKRLVVWQNRAYKLFELGSQLWVVENPLAPKWGKDMAEKMTQQCQ